MPEGSMGYEMYMEALCNQAEYSGACNRLERARNPEWKKKDGTTIKLKDMTTEHIGNCIKLLMRNPRGDYGDIWINKFIEELTHRLKTNNTERKV